MFQVLGVDQDSRNPPPAQLGDGPQIVCRL